MSKNIYNINLAILQSHPYFGEKRFRNKFPNLVNEIYSKTSFLDSYNPSFSERRYCYVNKITEIVKCKICGSKVKYNNCYSETCCKQCFIEYMKGDAHEKCKITKLIKHGNENYNNSESIKYTKNHYTEEKKQILHQKYVEAQSKIDKIKVGNKISHARNNFSNQKWIEISLKTKPKIYKNKYIQPNQLYIIFDSIQNSIKIGISKNTQLRFKHFQKLYGQHIQILNIFNIDNAYKIESYLHSKFIDYNLNNISKCFDGYTEWFSYECYENVVQEIKNYLN